jgi:hypothetical protein
VFKISYANRIFLIYSENALYSITSEKEAVHNSLLKKADGGQHKKMLTASAFYYLVI